MSILGYVLIGGFGTWYLLFPRSVLRLNECLSIAKKEKKRPTPTAIRVMGAVIVVGLFTLWYSQR